MSSNFRPSIRTTDWGTWRRVKIIPWGFRVTQANRDEQLKSKLRHEAPGILNWMLCGLAGYVSAEYNMHFPAIVDNATAEYRISQDVVGQFMSARCNLSGKVTVADLYSAFTIWAEQSRERHNLTLRKFGDELVKHAGICRAQDKNGSLFQGISLQISPEERTLTEMADLL
jgi:putative DNA primase/helicase